MNRDWRNWLTWICIAFAWFVIGFATAEWIYA
jgi:hypothetical protein